MHSDAIIIAPPLHGEWAIYNPPGHPPLAYDFLAVDNKKSLYRNGSFLKHFVSTISVEDTYTWGKPVLSPVDGEVLESHDVEADRTKICFSYDLFRLLLNKPKVSDGFGAFGGNFVLIKSEGFYVLLCHLRNGSTRVKSGDNVRVGQQIGEAGNSGSSIQPHLHIQVMSSSNYFPLFKNLLPFRISSGKIRTQNGDQQVDNIKLQNRGHYVFKSCPLLR